MQTDPGCLDRLPPHSREAERCVLGSMLRDNAVIDDVLVIVGAIDFYADAHQKIFEGIRTLHDRGHPADLVTLAEYLKEQKHIEDAGGYAYLGELWDAAPTAANAEYYARIVRDKALVRNLIHASTEILREAYDQAMPADELLGGAERKILAIAEARAGSDTVRHDQLIDPAFERLDERSTGRSARAVRTSLVELDDVTAGLHDSELIVIAARPSIGKTALALWLAHSVCIGQGMPVLFASLEQSLEDLVDRLLLVESGVNGYRFRHGQVNHAEAEALAQAGSHLKAAARTAGIYFHNAAGQTVGRIAANARRYKRRHAIRLVVVDYLQLVPPDSRRENRDQQVSAVARGLKQLAGELRVPVVALAQLNRKVEDRQEKRPKLSDLRDSGDIEQAADLILLLWHPNPADEHNAEAIVECLIEKQRNGPKGAVHLRFDKARGRFEDVSPVSMAGG